MSERPWLESADPALRAERSLLKRLNAQSPPPGSVEHGWAALSGEIAGLQGLGAQVDPGQVAHVASSSGGYALAAKVAVGALVAGGALWAGGALVGSGDPATAPSYPARQADPPALAPVIQPAALPQAGSAEPGEPPANKAAPLGPSRSSATTLAEEGRLLAKAHQLVQAGQARQALEVLRASEARFPRSALAQEREVLTIEALSATGNTGAAEQRAQRFLKRHPKSAHAGRLQRFVK